MSLEILNAGQPYPEGGDSSKRFVPLPMAVKRDLVDTSTKTPTEIQQALTQLWAGRMPGETGLVDTGSKTQAALDLMAFRHDGRNMGSVLPLPKDAIDAHTKQVRRDGIVFLTNIEGLFIPVVRVRDLSTPGAGIEADFLGLPRSMGGIAVQALSRLEIGTLEATDYDEETGVVAVQTPRRYF